MIPTKASQPLHGEQIKEVKPWRLPYWTGEPDFAPEDNNADADQNDAAANEPVEVAELPTVEEVEKIRREAYTAGLEQGLIEGRQKGHQEGLEQGHKEGHQKGFDEGKQQGHTQGQTEGEQQGREQGLEDMQQVAAHVQALANTLQMTLNERDAQLPKVMAHLVEQVAKHVLRRELHTGCDTLATFIQQAIDALPTGLPQVCVWVSAQDKPYVEQANANVLPRWDIQVDDNLDAGQCRVQGEHSLVEIDLEQQFGQHIHDLANRLLYQDDAPEPAELHAPTLDAHADESVPDAANAQQAQEQTHSNNAPNTVEGNSESDVQGHADTHVAPHIEPHVENQTESPTENPDANLEQAADSVVDDATSGNTQAEAEPLEQALDSQTEEPVSTEAEQAHISEPTNFDATSAAQPDAIESVASESDGTEPEVTESETREPETTELETTEPDTLNSHASAPEDTPTPSDHAAHGDVNDDSHEHSLHSSEASSEADTSAEPQQGTPASEQPLNEPPLAADGSTIDTPADAQTNTPESSLSDTPEGYPTDTPEDSLSNTPEGSLADTQEGFAPNDPTANDHEPK